MIHSMEGQILCPRCQKAMDCAKNMMTVEGEEPGSKLNCKDFPAHYFWDS